MSFVKQLILDTMQQYMRRFVIHNIITGEEITADLTEVPGVVTQTGTSLNAALLNRYEDELGALGTAAKKNTGVIDGTVPLIGAEDKLDASIIPVPGSVTGSTVAFSAAETAAAIATGESTATLFGKILKWFNDFKPAVFSNPVNDLTHTDTEKALSANQGKVLKTALDACVTGPETSTDNAIARFDSTTGKVLQNGLATVDDSGSVNIPSGQSYKINGTALGVANITGAAPLASPAFTGTPTAPTGTDYTTARIRNLALVTTGGTPANGNLEGVYS